MELMKVIEVAEYLRIHPEVVRRWLREGKLKGYKVGKEWRISKRDIDDMIKGKD